MKAGAEMPAVEGKTIGMIPGNCMAYCHNHPKQYKYFGEKKNTERPVRQNLHIHSSSLWHEIHVLFFLPYMRPPPQGRRPRPLEGDDVPAQITAEQEGRYTSTLLPCMPKRPQILAKWSHLGSSHPRRKERCLRHFRSKVSFLLAVRGWCLLATMPHMTYRKERTPPLGARARAWQPTSS